MANKAEIRRAIKSLEAMRTCKKKEFEMSSYIIKGAVCDTSLCLAGDAVARKYGLKRCLRDYNTDGSILNLYQTIEERAMKMFRLNHNRLFHVGTWSLANSAAYRTAKALKDYDGMIDAGIAELKLYL